MDFFQGNKRTPERFVGRQAVVTAQCLNGWLETFLPYWPYLNKKLKTMLISSENPFLFCNLRHMHNRYVVKTLDNAESVKLQYRSLAKIADGDRSSAMVSSNAQSASWL